MECDQIDTDTPDYAPPHPHKAGSFMQAARRHTGDIGARPCQEQLTRRGPGSAPG